MRFEVGAAYVLGVLLPVGETIRRWGRIESITSYADDLLIGGLLLVAAWSVTRRKTWGNPLLIAVWGVLCGGLYYSFFGQVERGVSTDTSGLANGVVIAIKGAIYVIAIIALVRAIRSARVVAVQPGVAVDDRS